MKTMTGPYDGLPNVLNAAQLAQTLRISRAGAYILMNSRSFPTLRISGRKLVPKKHLLAWIDQQVKGGMPADTINLLIKQAISKICNNSFI